LGTAVLSATNSMWPPDGLLNYESAAGLPLNCRHVPLSYHWSAGDVPLVCRGGAEDLPKMCRRCAAKVPDFPEKGRYTPFYDPLDKGYIYYLLNLGMYFLCDFTEKRGGE
jgi:hypothetical protein